MTTRQRQGTGGATATLSHSNGVGTSHDHSVPMKWDDWLRHASAQQRATVLGLALQQGLLYPHQLPPVTNGVKPAPVPVKESDVSIRLSNLLAGKGEPLPSPTLDPINFFDADLDELQQQAVVRALGTPDVFLLQGLPGTGKSRVLAEIVLQAAARGQRVLLLGAHSASIDVVLERLVSRPEILALRYLDPAEKPDALPAWLRELTPEEQKRALLDRASSGAHGHRAATESVCRSHRAVEPVWQTLQTCLERIATLTEQLSRIDEQAAHHAEAVEQDANAAAGDTPFCVKMTEWRKQRDEAVAAIDAKRTTLQEAQTQFDKEAADLAARIALLEPGYRAKKQARFWSPSFWTSLFNGRIVEEMESLQGQQAQVAARHTALAQEFAQVDVERQELLNRFAAERTAFVNSEIDARRQHLQREREPLEQAARALDEDWQSLCATLKLAGLEKSEQAVATAQKDWLDQKERDEEQCQFAQQWSAYIDGTVADYAARLPQFANVVATTIPHWHSDAKLRDSLAPPVDLVIVEDADTLSDADLVKFARGGQRCVLTAPAFLQTHNAEAPSSFQRLWQALGGDDGASTCVWRRNDGRFVCRLIPFTTDEQQYLENEGLADAPDIELGILQRPDAAPCLAQVVFGPSRTFGDAFQFMMREVQEFPLAPVGRTGWWHEDAEQVMRCLGLDNASAIEWAEIEPGIRLGTVAFGDTLRVARIAFAKSAGFDRARAEDWLKCHRPGSERERTVFLDTPYRFRPALANVLGPLAYNGIRPASESSQDHDGGRAFEFIAVPALPKKDWPAEGAGFELDLSVARMADRLPAGLRQGLPPRGFVNYVEAQALVRRLETFCQKDVNGQSCRVVATALYESQTELIRRLIAQSEILRNSRVPIEITMPDRLCQRECDVLFLSLTRSHDQPAAAFGVAQELALSLTRARTRLFVFGDPGTLSKHSSAEKTGHDGVLISRLATLLRTIHNTPARPANTSNAM